MALELTIEPVDRNEVLGPVRRAIPEVWVGVTEERLREILPTHASRDGFRFLAARSGGRLLGFAYGYRGGPDQWWHDIVSAAMSEDERRRWLAPGHFEVVELHVHPDHRRRGLGTRLHDALLKGLDSRTAVLSTQTDNDPALALYRRKGWQVVVPRITFSRRGDEYAVLGLDLQSRRLAKRRPVSSNPSAR